MEEAVNRSHDHVRIVTRAGSNRDVAAMLPRRVGAVASDLGEPGSANEGDFGRISRITRNADGSKFSIVHEAAILNFSSPSGTHQRPGWETTENGQRRAMASQMRLYTQAAVEFATRAAELIESSDAESMRTYMLGNQADEARSGGRTIHPMIAHMGNDMLCGTPWSYAAIGTQGRDYTALPDLIEEFVPRTVVVIIEGSVDRPILLFQPMNLSNPPLDAVERMRAIAEMPERARIALEKMP
jgi:hypothetical protein